MSTYNSIGDCDQAHCNDGKKNVAPYIKWEGQTLRSSELTFPHASIATKHLRRQDARGSMRYLHPLKKLRHRCRRRHPIHRPDTHRVALPSPSCMEGIRTFVAIPYLSCPPNFQRPLPRHSPTSPAPLTRIRLRRCIRRRRFQIRHCNKPPSCRRCSADKDGSPATDERRL